MANDKIFLGTELKLNINIEKMGEFTMDDYDWVVDVYCSTTKVVTIHKQSAIRIDENNYVLLVETSELGAGRIKCKVVAYIPDFDFPDGLRTEVSIIDTGKDIIRTI